MAGKALKTRPELVLGTGDAAFAISAATLLAMQPGEDTDRGNEYSKAGVVLVDRSVKDVYLQEGDQVFKVTGYLRITRSPITDDEQAEVNAVAETQDERKERRAKEEQAKREREISAAVERSNAQQLDTLLNLDKFQRAAAAMSKR